jgi:hypothetical protein
MEQKQNSITTVEDTTSSHTCIKPLVSGSLSWQQASNILERHNRWRRGEDIPMENPTILGIAIDTVLNELESAMCYISCGELNFR